MHTFGKILNMQSKNDWNAFPEMTEDYVHVADLGNI